MSDIDRVFSNFTDDSPVTSPRRQVVTIPARGTRGSRVVQVVHLQSRSGAAEQAQPRHASDIGGAAWGAEVTGKGAPQAPAPVPAELDVSAPSAPQPMVHMMPAWEPRATVVQATAMADADADADDAAPPTTVKATRRPRSEAASRRVADPYDTSDDGANCIRCGYMVEPAREKRGLMTCAGCG